VENLMANNLLKIGMPAGSLANPNRGGNLISLLEDAGFKTSGYQSGGPSKFITSSFLFGWDGRPQEFGAQLGIEELDVAIAGDDWIRERTIELELEYDCKIKLEKALSLQRGGVRIVGIIPSDNDHATVEDYLREITANKKIINVVSEMPYLALNWMQTVLKKIGKDKEYAGYSVQKYKTPPKIESGIIIYETWGKTEAKIKNGGADLGLEITQTGSAIRNYGLKIVDEIMASETGIWINPQIKNDPKKLELLKMFLLNLYGTINAEDKVLILFNVENSKSDAIREYLKENNLFADEPTVNVGNTFTEYNIQLKTSDEKNPLALVRFELAKRGAKNIDTIPLSSAIPSIDVINR
jgi:ATP phosphoribosyltransferase